jgi:hypothetical protein
VADCCLLTDTEVGQLKHYNIQPNHFYHSHIPTKEALEQVKLGELDLVEGKDSRFFVTRPKMYFLARLKSEGKYVESVQRVLSNQPLHMRPV